MWGIIVNVLSIIFGSTLGFLVGKKLPESMSDTIMHGLSLAICLIGIKMALSTQNVLIIILSCVIGGILGEVGNIEGKVNRLGRWVEDRFSKGQETGSLTKAFVTSSLVFCVGAMAIIGPLESVINHNHSVLYAKSTLDGITSVVFASVMGPGVALSSLAVLVYQGSIALLAVWVQPLLNDQIITEITATGGLLILGIGLNLLKLTTIKIGNLLPAIIMAPFLVCLL